MTRLLIAATAILALVRVLSALPAKRRHAVSAPTSEAEVPRCCFGCGPGEDHGGVRYLPDERQTLLAVLPAPAAPTRAQRGR